MNDKELAKRIVDLVGGTENIISVRQSCKTGGDQM